MRKRIMTAYLVSEKLRAYGSVQIELFNSVLKHITFKPAKREWLWPAGQDRYLKYSFGRVSYFHPIIGERKNIIMDTFELNKFVEEFIDAEKKIISKTFLADHLISQWRHWAAHNYSMSDIEDFSLEFDNWPEEVGLLKGSEVIYAHTKSGHYERLVGGSLNYK